MTTRLDNTRTVRAPRGTERSAKSWLTEAPLPSPVHSGSTRATPSSPSTFFQKIQNRNQLA